MISRLYFKCAFLAVVALEAFAPPLYGATKGEVELARRVRNFLLNYNNTSRVGIALKDVIEGRANDGTAIPGNDAQAQLQQQKDEIQFHARTHRHFGSDNALLNKGEFFKRNPLYPSRFNVKRELRNSRDVTKICNDIVDLLLSGMVSFEVSQMQDLLPPALPQAVNNSIRSSRFLLTANLDGHHIFGLENPPCTYNRNTRQPLSSTGEQSTYVQLIVSAQTKYSNVIHREAQSVLVTLFPAPHRPVGNRDALAPVMYPRLTRLKHFLYENRTKIAVSMVVISAFLFVMYQLTRSGFDGVSIQPEL